ncbi:MAG TPA: alpha/beta hydrolase [Candidatus Limnocylindria bacterium]|nr:alpha/beta hydrolase [Candidatus Limnocylindria bacterium]
MPFAEVNGQRLYFEDTGGESGDVIVLSHGLLMDHAMFDPQVAALRDRWRCIAWDARAHGVTETSPEDFTYWDSASDLLGLLDHLGVERAVFAGMSQGGYLSLRAALIAPERVRALVLIDTQSGIESPANTQAYDQLIDVWAGAEEVPQEILDIVAAIILGNDWAGAAQWQDKWRTLSPDQLRQAYKTLVTREDDVTGRLPELAGIPAIVIHGEQDAAIEVETARALADALGAQLTVIDGAGHAANLTHPEPTNVALEAFLAPL